MSKQSVKIHFSHGFEQTEIVLPDFCPLCGKTIEPKIIGCFGHKTLSDDTNVCVTCRCTSNSCDKYFVLNYHSHISFHSLELVSSPYIVPVNISLPNELQDISPSFIKIYTEAKTADSIGLDSIAGVGYRKSAEFLIKDYLIKQNPDCTEDIKKKFLGNVINEYMSDFPKIQSLAKAVAWIGNDETHYQRKHNDKDINDLKKFIDATVHFIVAEYTADQAIAFTSDKNGK
ncbi:hypothetical protein CIRMBP1229_02171 [Enterococcus cecorum]|uniref:DUF4145 domain-containing protein n=1 Tax=Enterococcus cecorum TaxID=44008 RepID=UPI00200AE368|nr:DUF4145 domain-containing protein [Enterococcus cecorum]CAI3318029.1 hypothetical protein CIRMBP1228_00855 [Enterococcus cecorum]CAI3428639.1 hypothetical protein CIRMBP1216_01845 [Enterococcus cecorum]CAI3436998.1 hypothetical protein CIRMBP1221_01862 [Enterococcus cecorum]CAI3449132.1 hypothetical protein CIRMBP1218_01931 [Enterococcus cecorum]CAI3449220.1 hypothetical protein CIRMBP1224_01950 [Enterococcus cecorum]